MPIDTTLFDDDATPAALREALTKLRKCTKRGADPALDWAALADALVGATATSRRRIADALRTQRVLNPPPAAVGIALAEVATREAECATDEGARQRLLALFVTMAALGGLEHVPASALLVLDQDDCALAQIAGLPLVLSRWCEEHVGAIPETIVDWVRGVRDLQIGDHPGLDTLLGWLAPSAESMTDLAAWESSARALASDDRDFEGLETVQQAIAHHGDHARAALTAALAASVPEPVRVVLEEWQRAVSS